MGDNVHHRQGPLKQTNKAHKTGRHRSKGAIDNALKGKVSLNASSHRHRQEMRKEQRRNQIKQIRQNKRQEVLAEKRKLGGENTSPFLICLLPMHGGIDAKSALAILESCDEEAIVNRTASGVTYINLVRFKQRYAFLIPPVGRGNETIILDYLKVCDTTVLLTSASVGEEDVFDNWGHRIFNMISAQGIPTPIVALMDLVSINPKKRFALKASIQKFISKILPQEKVMQLDTSADGLNVMRRIGGQKKNNLPNRINRPHLLGESVEFLPNYNKEDNSNCLKISGFLRGVPLDINGLVHIPGLGDFQMSHLDVIPDPYQTDKSNGEGNDAMRRFTVKADKSKQTPLQSENIPNSLDAEQTWPADEEMEESSHEPSKVKHVKKVPKGWSDYQAAWIPDIETVDENDDDNISSTGSNVSMKENQNDEDYFDAKSNVSSDNNSADEEFEMAESGTEDIGESNKSISDEKYDQQMNLQEEREDLKKIKEARVDEMWPDEIDTPIDVPARQRFQKYRGLESFRTTKWDPTEDLPSDYARIFQFQNFDRTKRRILSEVREINGLAPGYYIDLYVSGVAEDQWLNFKSAQKNNHLIVYGLLPHENQMSVMNVVLKRIPDSEVPIKSKETLIIQCGYRRFKVNPIFSQHTNGDKHKYERFFRPNETVCATFYAPIQYPPAPILAFKTNPDSSLNLIARGCLLSCNPNRIILKRIVLSGHPMRINRKSATIRYMFFNKDDVDYFKPVKLRTKCGRLGHIKESLGTHGHMKCYFDGQLRSYDTAFMSLYKRVYPKWTYDPCNATANEQHNHNDPSTAMTE